MSEQDSKEKYPEKEEVDLDSLKQDYLPGDELSRKVLKRWKEGVIICLRPTLFMIDDDTEMI